MDFYLVCFDGESTVTKKLFTYFVVRIDGHLSQQLQFVYHTESPDFFYQRHRMVSKHDEYLYLKEMLTTKQH